MTTSQLWLMMVNTSFGRRYGRRAIEIDERRRKWKN
jgi:hypothetical protein